VGASNLTTVALHLKFKLACLLSAYLVLFKVMSEVPIVVCGSIAIDRIMSFNGSYRDYIQPDKLNSLSVSIFLNELRDLYGGVGANIVYSLALLGDKPLLVGVVGSDAASYIERLALMGVDISYVHQSKLPTASFNVITDADQNQVGGFYPGAMFDSASLTFAPWKDSKAVHVVAPHDPEAMKRQVAECKTWSLRLCYDVGQQVSNLSGDDMRAGIEAAELLIVNDYEMSVMSKKTGLSIDTIKSTVPVVVTTLGKEGSVIEGSKLSQLINIGVVEPIHVADPTGAGDAFRSGLLYGYVRSWPLKASAQLGAVCATFAIESFGTQGHHFTPEQVTKRYELAFEEPVPSNINKE
jgi:adenosine kinase